MSVLCSDQVRDIVTHVNDQLEERCSNIRNYSFVIDHSISDPSEMISYEDDLGCEAMSPEWMGLLGIRPCVLKDGEVLYYLNPDNFNYKEDGTPADITTIGNDVMIEFPKMGIKGVWISKDKLKVTLTTARHARDFDYSAFSNTSYNDSDYLYVGAYLPSWDGVNPVLYSSSDRTIIQGRDDLSDFRSLITPRGSGYYPLSYAVQEFLLVLYCLVSRNLDSEQAVRVGRVAGYGDAAVSIRTGASASFGMLSQFMTSEQKNDYSLPIKFLGIEDLWGCFACWTDGIFIGRTIEESFGEGDICHANVYRSITHSGMSSTDSYKISSILKMKNIYDGDDYCIAGGFITRIHGKTGSIFLPEDAFVSNDDSTLLSYKNLYYADTYEGVFNLSDSVYVGTGGRPVPLSNDSELREEEIAKYVQQNASGIFCSHIFPYAPTGGFTTRLIYLK